MGRRSRTRKPAGPSLVFDEPALAPQPAAVAGQRAVGSDDAMARDDDPDLVRAIGARHGPYRGRTADGGRAAQTLRVKAEPCCTRGVANSTDRPSK